MLPLFIVGKPPDAHAGVPNLLSKCTHVGVTDIGSTYDQTPEFLAEFHNCLLREFVNVWPTSNAVPA